MTATTISVLTYDRRISGKQRLVVVAGERSNRLRRSSRPTRINPASDVNPLVSLIAVTFGSFLLVPPFVSVYRTGQRIADAQQAAGLPATCNGALGLVLIFVFGTYPLYYQSEMNKIASR